MQRKEEGELKKFQETNIEKEYRRNVIHLLHINASCSLATYNQHVGMQQSHIQPTEDIFNSNDPRIKEVFRT